MSHVQLQLVVCYLTSIEIVVYVTTTQCLVTLKETVAFHTHFSFIIGICRRRTNP